MDAIAEMEMPPAFPKNEGRHPFLVSIDHSKGQLPLIVDTEMLLREGMPFLGYDICLIFKAISTSRKSPSKAFISIPLMCKSVKSAKKKKKKKFSGEKAIWQPICQFACWDARARIWAHWRAFWCPHAHLGTRAGI